MSNNRLSIVCIVFLCLVLCLPGFAIGQETSNVASWFIHDDHPCRTRRDATSQNESNVVAKLVHTDSVSFAKSRASPDFNRDPVIRGSGASSRTRRDATLGKGKRDATLGKGKRDATLGKGKQDATYIISWSVLNSGGKTEEATSASYRLKDAIGQPVIGKCESASYKAYIGFWAPSITQIVGVEEGFGDQDALPLVYSLSQNYPNPMGSATQIEYAIPTAGRVNIRIYNISGQLVKTLVDELQEPGQYRISWDGRDQAGQRAAPGVYFYKLEVHTGLRTGDYKNTKKMILLR